MPGSLRIARLMQGTRTLHNAAEWTLDIRLHNICASHAILRPIKNVKCEFLKSVPVSCVVRITGVYKHTGGRSLHPKSLRGQRMNLKEMKFVCITVSVPR